MRYGARPMSGDAWKRVTILNRENLTEPGFIVWGTLVVGEEKAHLGPLSDAESCAWCPPPIDYQIGYPPKTKPPGPWVFFHWNP